MKRLILVLTLLLTFCFVAQGLPASAEAPLAGSLIVMDKNVPAGQKVVVPIHASGVTDDINRMTFELSYNSAIVDIDSCVVKAPFTGACNIDFEHDRSGNDTIRVSLVTTTNLKGAFDIAELTFQALGPDPSYTPLSLRVEVFALDSTPVTFTEDPGSVTIGSLPMSVDMSKNSAETLNYRWIILSVVLILGAVLGIIAKRKQHLG